MSKPGIPIKDREFICPNCGGNLKFDIHDSKKHCVDCGKIWTFEVKGTKLIAHQWLSFKGVDMRKHYSKVEL